jgi:phosphomannomutase
VRERGAAGGIMITSSHNPAQWNGVKYKAWYGGSGKPSIIAEIESLSGPARARRRAKAGADYRGRFSADVPEGHRELCRPGPDREVRHEVRHRLDVRRGGTIISDIFTRLGVAARADSRRTSIRCFRASIPSRSSRTFARWARLWWPTAARPGLCTDGDADRIGATDEHGEFVDPHKIFSCC